MTVLSAMRSAVPHGTLWPVPGLPLGLAFLLSGSRRSAWGRGGGDA